MCVLLQALLQKPNVTLPDVNAILSAALAQHNANVQVRRPKCAVRRLPAHLNNPGTVAGRAGRQQSVMVAAASSSSLLSCNMMCFVASLALPAALLSNAASSRSLGRLPGKAQMY